MYLKGFITNLGKYNKGKVIGEWIEFPIDEDDFEDVLERIEIDGENYKDYIFTRYETDIDPELYISRHEDIDNLNEFGELLQNVKWYQEDLVNAIVEEYTMFDYVLELLRNIDDQELINVNDAKKYGLNVKDGYSKTSYGYLRIF